MNATITEDLPPCSRSQHNFYYPGTSEVAEFFCACGVMLARIIEFDDATTRIMFEPAREIFASRELNSPVAQL